MPTPLRPPYACSRYGGARLEISRISVDEASLNLVRTGPGRWNLDSFFRTAAARTGSSTGWRTRPVTRCPTLKPPTPASISKMVRKSCPFRSINTDSQFWQQDSGELAHPAARPAGPNRCESRSWPIQGSCGWKQVCAARPLCGRCRCTLTWIGVRRSLASLPAGDRIRSRLAWRPDRRTACGRHCLNAAQVTTRLRATGVHRAEFAPGSAHGL